MKITSTLGPLVAGTVIVAGAVGTLQMVPESSWRRLEGTGGDGGVVWIEEPGTPRVPECRGFDALVPCAAAPGFRCEGDGATVPLAVLAPSGLHGEALSAGEPPLLGLYSAGVPLPLAACPEGATEASFAVVVRDPAAAWPGCLAGEVVWTDPGPSEGPDGPMHAPRPFTWERRPVEERVPGELAYEDQTLEGPDGGTMTLRIPIATWTTRAVKRDVPVPAASGVAFQGRCCLPGCACASERCGFVPPAPRVGHERGWECHWVPEAPDCPEPQAGSPELP